MAHIDLELLKEQLDRPTPSMVLGKFLSLLRTAKDLENWQALLSVPWEALIFPSPCATHLHIETVLELRHNQSAFAVRSASELFEKAGALEPQFICVLKYFNSSTCGGDAELRTAPVYRRADGRHPTFTYPQPELIKSALMRANEVRELDGFFDPVWRALLVSYLVNHVHPFVDGNGRTSRTLFCYELWRSGVMGCYCLPLRRVLAANRANEIQLKNLVTAARTIESRTIAVFRVLLFDLLVATKTLEVLNAN